MNYRALGNTGISVSSLGLGCMRLPLLDADDPKSIDENRAIEMIRYAIDHGVNYIDTAYPYHGGLSEGLVGKALRDGYRERIRLVTKSPTWLIEKEDDFHEYLDEQLERLQTSYLDVYLLHALNKERFEKLVNLGIFDAIAKAKYTGKILNVGFSFHDDHEAFKEICDAYDWDVCMVQFNYMDQDEQAELKGIKYAGSKGIPVVAMEPLKGGVLANPPEDVKSILRKSDRFANPVDWALNWIAQHEEIKVVLSGMSTLDQLIENIHYSEQFEVNSLSESDNAIIDEAKERYLSRIEVGCTDCKYCMPCPHGVDIPKVFTIFNKASVYNDLDRMKSQYGSAGFETKKADLCVRCGACEPQCPQKIMIMDELERAHAALT